MIRRAIAGLRAAADLEPIIVVVGMLALVGSQLTLSATMHGTSFAYGDGKMAQAVILAAQKFGGFLQFNNLSPIQGLGSQMLPLNVWLSPAHWPFAIVDKGLATDISAAIAIAIYALAIYVMARCFDVPPVPSIIAAQFSIVLFAPMLYFLQLFVVFSALVGNAVVYAPHMAALGLLARLEPGSWRNFVLITAGIFGLLLYSLCCDPLWSIVSGLSWVIPFAIVTLSPLRARPVLLRLAALACCLLLLIASGAMEYLYTLVQYTARFHIGGLDDRVRQADSLASSLFGARYSKYFYIAWIFGWILGLSTLRGRPRVLVITGLLAFAFLAAETVIYLLLQSASWTFPLPTYTEHCLFPLFIASAATGYWGGLRAVLHRAQSATGDWPGAWIARSPLHRFKEARPATLAKAAMVVLVPVAAAITPVVVKAYGTLRSTDFANRYNEPWPNEPELVEFLSQETAAALGRPFRGATLFWFYDYAIGVSMANLWVRSVPTILEYSQLVTAQSVYFKHAVLKNDALGLNGFLPVAVPSSWDIFTKVLPLLGTRYYIIGDHPTQSPAELSALANRSGYSLRFLPQGTHLHLDAAGRWYVYEIPHPNLGDYSPTEVSTAATGAEAAALMRRPDFDFTKQAVLSAPLHAPLVPARNMQLSWIRGGLHLSGQSDGKSLVVLPQQFSHCLRARDPRVRLVRANIMLTGVVFEDRIDTDIVFDYGVFTPACHRADLTDIRSMRLHIDVRAAPRSGDRLFPSLNAAMAKLRAAASSFK